MLWSKWGQSAGRVSGLVKDIDVANSSDTIHVIYIKLCEMVLHIKLRLFIPLSIPLTIFQGHSSVNQLQLKIKFDVMKQLSWNFAWLCIKSTTLWICYYLWPSSFFKGYDWNVFCFWGKKESFFSKSPNARTFLHCMVDPCFGVFRFLLNLMTLILFQGHRFVGNMKCNSFFSFLFWFMPIVV